MKSEGAMDALTARFYGVRGTFTLDVDLNLPHTGITGIFGPSGSGKTSLLRALAGLDRHPKGYVQVGETLWQDESGYFVPPYKRALGYVFQEPALFPHLTIEKNLRFGFKRTPLHKRKLAIDTLIQGFDLTPFLSRYPHQLSGGEQQRVALARALANHPELLLMDEPLSGLDEPRKQELMPYLEQLHQQLDIPALYVSHSLREIARLADYLVLLDGGKIRATGPVNELFTRLDLPLAHRPDACAVIQGTIAYQDDPFSLTQVAFPGGKLWLPYHTAPTGAPVRLQIAARDVSITLHPPQATSILNILEATVEAIEPTAHHQFILRLRVGSSPLLARITQRSATTLNLHLQQQVFAQVKSVALLL